MRKLTWIRPGAGRIAALARRNGAIAHVAEAGDLLLLPTRAAFEGSLVARQRRPLASVVMAELGNDAGVVGAAGFEPATS